MGYEFLSSEDVNRLTRMKDQAISPFTGELIGTDRLALSNTGRSAADTIALPATNPVRLAMRRLRELTFYRLKTTV